MRPSSRPARALRALLPLLALLPLAGCDDEGLDLNGEYVAEVTGDVTSDLAGEAVYTTFDGPDGPTFVLLFFRGDLGDNDEDAYAYVALWREGEQPGTGVYPIQSAQTTEGTFFGSYADLVDAETPEASGPVISATDGVLTITDADAGILAGSFRFDGEGLLLPETDEFIAASVSGTFEARFVQPSVVNSLSIDFDFD
jgi:hypothetical protein